MIKYLITFFISGIFAFIASTSKKKEKKKMFILCSFIAILIPSILAGIRAPGVGTDTLVYIGPFFEKACNSTNVFKYITNRNIEPLYLLVNYIISRFTNSVNVLYFALQLIIMTFVYLACLETKKDNYYLPYIFFMILSFNRSLNMCRQTIAISIILFACYRYAFNGKLAKFIVMVIIAAGFHKIAYIAISMYFIHYLINNKNYSTINKFALICALCVFFIGFQPIMKALINHNIINSKYDYYVSSGNSNLIKIETILECLILFITLLLNRYLLSKDKLNNTLTLFLVFDIVLYFLGIYANYAQRIAYFFGYFNIFILAEYINLFKNKKQKSVIAITLIMLLCIYSSYYYGYHNYHGTVPYKSILRII